MEGKTVPRDLQLLHGMIILHIVVIVTAPFLLLLKIRFRLRIRVQQSRFTTAYVQRSLTPDADGPWESSKKNHTSKDRPELCEYKAMILKPDRPTGIRGNPHGRGT